MLDAMSIQPEISAKTLTQLVAMEIRVAMTRADIKQSELARHIGKTEQWLSVRLRGKQAIDLNDLALIAGGLKVGIQELLPPPEDQARAVRAAGSFNATLHTTTPSGHPNGRTDTRRPKTGPYAGGRQDSVRPVSAIPVTQRKPKALRPLGRRGDRPMPR